MASEEQLKDLLYKVDQCSKKLLTGAVGGKGAENRYVAAYQAYVEANNATPGNWKIMWKKPR